MEANQPAPRESQDRESQYVTCREVWKAMCREACGSRVCVCVRETSACNVSLQPVNEVERSERL